MSKKLNWNYFNNTYIPIENHISENNSFDNLMFETYGKDLEYIINLSSNTKSSKYIWTLIDDEGLFIIPGYHYFNRLGYFITEIPYKNMDEIIKI